MNNSKLITPKNALLSLKENIVFVSGCFDLIHFGHINFFREVKNKTNGAKLLVVIHDDESIKKKKGENRPLMTLNERLEVLAELESVDYVCSWNGWEDVKDFMVELKPKFYAVTKGEPTNKFKAEVAESIGTEFIEIEKIEGLSSTNLINKIGI